MSSAGAVAYNPDDPLQASFLASLALGETGGNANAYSEGYGGVNLSSVATDQYGFPEWSGNGSTTAAGAFQFEPSTWDAIAATDNLNFQDPTDQNAGAWYLAQQTYAQKTGGSLESALTSGAAGNSSVFGTIQSALASVWPSVTGNGAAPQGLANDLATGTGAPLSGTTSAINAATGSGTAAPASSGWFAEIQNVFLRFGLIIIGSIVILVSLYFLLSNSSTAKHIRAAI